MLTTIFEVTAPFADGDQTVYIGESRALAFTAAVEWSSEELCGAAVVARYDVIAADHGIVAHRVYKARFPTERDDD